VVGKKFRSTLGAAFWSFGAMEGEPVAQPDEHHLLHGLPGSPGTAIGIARTVRDASEFGCLEPGNIVVCAVTTAAWSPIFGVIGGLVTERGGPLSHPATLAREYGLPAVLSAAGAMARIPDGARVRIDGATGVVEILDT
jgi:pyruvate,water dikinase